MFKNLAKLSRLNFPERFKKDLENIISYVGKLNSVNTEGVEPLSHVHGAKNVWREDLVVSSSPEEILEGAPDKSGTFVRTPLVIDG